LHPGIAKAYTDKRAKALAEADVEVAAVAAVSPGQNEGAATIATVSGDRFLADPLLHEEVFGPYSLLVRCRNQAQMLQVAKTLEGQLTASVMGMPQEIAANSELVDLLQQRCGRFILNGVPTGVEVCLSMQHGGPYPASTDSRYTSVGADGIKRFARPITLQNWEDDLLPDALKNSNPLGIWRTVNDQFTREGIGS
jgi:alpha-ketoglutaric semialdehyde dehydrogenase